MVRHHAGPGVRGERRGRGPVHRGHGGRVPRVEVAVRGAEAAEHAVAGLAEQQLLVGVGGALGHDLPALAGHQVPQLVDEEGGREVLDPAGGDGDELAAHRASEHGLCLHEARHEGNPRPGLWTQAPSYFMAAAARPAKGQRPAPEARSLGPLLSNLLALTIWWWRK